jgi:hypothetical protein
MTPVWGVGSSEVAQIAARLISAVDRQSRAAIPRTPDNLSFLERWMANEGGLWANNPLNTDLDAGRYPHQISTNGQDTGTPIFPSMAIGIEATATTLLRYPTILGVLHSGDASCMSFALAVIRSPWAASHYGNNPSRFCS